MKECKSYGGLRVQSETCDMSDRQVVELRTAVLTPDHPDGLIIRHTNDGPKVYVGLPSCQLPICRDHARILAEVLLHFANHQKLPDVKDLAMGDQGG